MQQGRPASHESVPDVRAPGESEEGAGPKTERNPDAGAPGKSEEGAGPNVKTVLTPEERAQHGEAFRRY
eukprot:12897361-Prorocentrum_lima.AAC.1